MSDRKIKPRSLFLIVALALVFSTVQIQGASADTKKILDCKVMSDAYALYKVANNDAVVAYTAYNAVVAGSAADPVIKAAYDASVSTAAAMAAAYAAYETALDVVAAAGGSEGDCYSDTAALDAKAKAACDKAKADVDKAKTDVAKAKTDVAKAKTDVVKAKTNVAKAFALAKANAALAKAKAFAKKINAKFEKRQPAVTCAVRG